MKTIAWAGFMICNLAALAQEGDDMYFNRKDRAKLPAKPTVVETFVQRDEPVRFDYAVNASTARASNEMALAGAAYQQNPEYIARSQSEMAVSEEEQAYFLENYRYASQQQFSQYSNNLNNWNNTPLYSNTYFSPSINNWNSPYYSPYNDPFLSGYNSNPWCNNAFRSGWSVAFSYGWGNPWNYWGPSAYWSYYWGDPFWNFGYGYSWGNRYWNNGYYYPIVIVDNNGRSPIYGKRGSRSKSVAGITTTSRDRGTTVRSSSQIASYRSASSGREEYYTPPSRRQSLGGQSGATRTFDSRSSGDFNRGNSMQRSSGSFSTPSRSSGSFGTPSRSSGGGSGGARSSSRGRGN